MISVGLSKLTRIWRGTSAAFAPGIKCSGMRLSDGRALRQPDFLRGFRENLQDSGELEFSTGQRCLRRPAQGDHHVRQAVNRGANERHLQIEVFAGIDAGGVEIGAKHERRRRILPAWTVYQRAWNVESVSSPGIETASPRSVLRSE